MVHGMVDAEILAYYEHGLEQDRLAAGGRQIGFLRTWDLLGRYLPSPPASVLDVGGGAGVHALPLAAAGYEVHLVDPVPLHVRQAAAASRAAAAQLASVTLGDARALEAAGSSFDAVLLLGPLYHLTSKADRITALTEARRVARPGGLVVVEALSRFYLLLETLARDPAPGPGDLEETARFLADGQYRNPGGDPARFTTSYFHRPEELTSEIREAGLDVCVLAGANGIVKLLPDFAQRLEEPAQRDHVLSVLRLLETEPSIIGMSQNFIAISRVPTGD
jgi:ubiquinone/menaquinone biosynthesis C-methylase UbiE